MPTLNRAPNEKELEKLISIYLKAETDIINEIGRLRSKGLVDYAAVAALERVQAILRKMESDSWEYVPKMIEKQFYVRVPEARKELEIQETPEKHAAGYANAAALTGDQMDLVQSLTQQLMAEITDATMTAMATVQSSILGRIEPDVYRRVGLEQVAAMQATGRGANAVVPGFVEALRREGITAFTDKAGRRWSLHTYCSMVTRTTSRQAEIAAVLSADQNHDLYLISSHGTTCALCAPYEGRVYSKSGTDPDFPPLSAAFGKIDPSGPDNLANTWLNIHPNCLHVLDYQKICQIEEEQLSTLGAEITTVASNMFFQTMDESAISLWEQVLQIVPNPVTEDLAFRQYRVINRLSTHPPYTLGFLYQKLDSLIGPGEWTVEVDYPNYHLTLTTSLQNAIYEGETIYLVNKIKPAHIGWNILYKDTPTSQIYVGTVGRRALVEITQNIQTPKQGLMPAWVGMYERHGGTVISTVICSSFLQNQIYVGIVGQQATIELTNGIQTPKQGMIPTWIGMYERHGCTVISIVDCTPTLKNQIYNRLLTRQADKEVF